MDDLQRVTAPPRPSLAWSRNEVRRWWADVSIRGILFLLVAIILIVCFVAIFPLKFLLGIFNFCTGYYHAAVLDSVLQESCASFRYEGWPFFGLSYSDYLRWNRCLGNEAGFDRQGQLLLAVQDLIFYILGRFGVSPTLFVIIVVTVSYNVPRVIQFLLDLTIYLFTATWIFGCAIVIVPLLLYKFGFMMTFILVVFVLVVVFLGSFVTGFLTTEDVMQALEAAAQNLFFAPIFSVYIYLSITITTTWRTLHDIPWMQRGECVHARLCRCQDTIERLQNEVQLERGNCEDRLNPLRDTLIECNIECETLQTRTRVLERERDNFRYIAERPTANNTTSSWGYAPAQPDFSVALDEARSRIGRLLVEADNERAVKLADIASYKDTINKLSAQVRYSAGAGQDRSQTRTELEHAKSTIRSLERSLKDITFTASELRQALAKEKETHSEKCQNQAICTRRILQLQVERDKFKHYQHENDLLARHSAKMIRGLRDSDVAHVTMRSYLAEMTTKFLEFQARGTPGLSTTDLQVEVVHRNYAEQMAIKDRLEREVERLGGDVDAIRLGRDTTRPQDWKIDTLTYEQNHNQIFSIYEQLAQTVINLNQLLSVHAPSLVPTWQADPARNDATKWSEDAPPSEQQLSKHYATINQVINPTSPHEPALQEKLMVKECQRWYNRGTQLLSIFISVCKDAHTTQIMTLEQANHINGVLAQADGVLKTVFYGVLTETCMLKRDDTEKQPSARAKRRFGIYKAMQHSITALTNSIRDNQKMPPRWPVLLPSKNVPIGRGDDLATHLVIQEMVTLEGRILQLRLFMNDYQMPGTIHGPGQSQIQGDDGKYSNEWGARVAALTYADLTLSHWANWKLQKPVQLIGEDGLPVFNEKREPVFKPRPEIESKLVPLISWDDFVITIKLKNAEVKKQDPDKWPEDIVPLYFLDPKLGPIIKFVPKSELNKNNQDEGKNNKQKNGKDDKNNSNDLGNDFDRMKARQEFETNTQRIQQLANHVRVWDIKGHMAMPQPKQLAKNASLETIKKAIAAQNESISLWSGLIFRSGRICPKWPKNGGPMKPKLG